MLRRGAPRERFIDDTVKVRVQPRARRDAIVGWRADGALSVRVTAPPLDGRANASVGVLLAEALGLRPSAVSVIRGERSRDKVVRVTGLARGEIVRRLRAGALALALLFLAAPPALAGSPGPASSAGDVALRFRLDDRAFRLNGWFVTPDGFSGFWLDGGRGDRGLTVQGRVQRDGRAHNFSLDAAPDSSGTLRWWQDPL